MLLKSVSKFCILRLISFARLLSVSISLAINFLIFMVRGNLEDDAIRIYYYSIISFHSTTSKMYVCVCLIPVSISEYLCRITQSNYQCVCAYIIEDIHK